MRLWIAVCVLPACAVTHGAGKLRDLEARLSMCIKSCPPGAAIQRSDCIEESMGLCVAAGLKPDCAVDLFEEDKRP